ncbi:hypothetical protein CIK06_12065 [Plantactinospora sp. KBS50]|nr:hypothetical protein CIK06_12065 [Plantactinospora sp. KBS50]
MEAALRLYLERPFELITLASVAESAQVGVQTLIRRVGTKDGLFKALQQRLIPEFEDALGAPPDTGDPAAVAAAVATLYERWGDLIDRNYCQQLATPALRETVQAGRRVHHDWVGAAFARCLTGLPPDRRRLTHARLVAVTELGLWLALTRNEGLNPQEACDAMTQLIAACLASPQPGTAGTAH